MNHVTLYQTQPHDCDYLSGQESTTIFVDPRFPKTMLFYDALMQQGFRRSGEQVYRPHCPQCAQCISVRIPVADFQPRRRQRRCWSRNQDLSVRRFLPKFDTEQYALFTRYVQNRHPSSDKIEHPFWNQSNYLQFLSSSWGNTYFYEFRLKEQLVAVAVVDEMMDAWSAVYTFFTPELTERSLGTFCVLWEIYTARSQGVKWLYLGYWIRDCHKMSYKTDYQPLEYFVNHRWIRQAHLRYP